MELAKTGISIKKDNLLETYGKARKCAFTTATIQAAWRKTGIIPLIPMNFQTQCTPPALATTTSVCAAALCLVSYPLETHVNAEVSLTHSDEPLDVDGPHASHPSSDDPMDVDVSPSKRFVVQIPPHLPVNASLAETRAQLEEVQRQLASRLRRIMLRSS